MTPAPTPYAFMLSTALDPLSDPLLQFDPRMRHGAVAYQKRRPTGVLARLPSKIPQGQEASAGEDIGFAVVDPCHQKRVIGTERECVNGPGVGRRGGIALKEPCRLMHGGEVPYGDASGACSDREETAVGTHRDRGDG